MDFFKVRQQAVDDIRSNLSLLCRTKKEIIREKEHYSLVRSKFVNPSSSTYK